MNTNRRARENTWTRRHVTLCHRVTCPDVASSAMNITFSIASFIEYFMFNLKYRVALFGNVSVVGVPVCDRHAEHTGVAKLIVNYGRHVHQLIQHWVCSAGIVGILRLMRLNKEIEANSKLMDSYLPWNCWTLSINICCWQLAEITNVCAMTKIRQL